MRGKSLHDPFAEFPSSYRRGEHRKPPREYAPPDPPPFDYEQTLRWLEYVKRDDWWQSQMPVSTGALDAVFGLYRKSIHQMLRGRAKATSRPVMEKIARVIPDIESRKLVFPEANKCQAFAGKVLAPRFVWLDLPAINVEISRLSAESAWTLWARCHSCLSNTFLPVAIDGKPHVACYSCLPPSQYRALGATAVKKSLIHEALKKYY